MSRPAPPSTPQRDHAMANNSSTLARSASSAKLKPFGSFEEYSAACPWAIFPRKKMDVTYRDIAAGLRHCLSLTEAQRAEYLDKITTLWDPSGHTMVALSVRTAFDLLLQTLNLPPGSEIICSAITIPDMIYLVKYHKLVPVPVDLKPDTLAMDLDTLRAAVTPSTKAILVAHIFGSRHPMDELLATAKELGLMVIEDCAQAFIGMQYTGEQGADVSMFSFGTIKTTTAFGGALIKIKDKSLLDELKRRESRYPARTTAFFAKRLLKYGFLHGITSPALFGLLLHACRSIGANHDAVITSAIRGFSGGELVSLIRFRPSMPLLGMLHHRLTTIDTAYIELRRQKSEHLSKLIEGLPQVEIPGLQARSHYYWLYPILVPRPDHVVQYMTQRGFDVTSGATQLAYVPSAKGEAHDPTYAKRIMSSIIYLPITAETPDWAVEKMVQTLKEALQFSRM